MFYKSEKSLEIKYPSDIGIARRTLFEIMEPMGFEKAAIADVNIVINELASNLVKHAKRGTLKACEITEKNRRGIQIMSIDNGPGIQNIDLAMRKKGLESVNRLMDEFKITSEPGKGTFIVCRKWLLPK